ncbi:MAG: HIT family protein [Myxococcota bacterium]
MGADCAICARIEGEAPIYQDAHWCLYPIEAPTPIVGWVYLASRRHTPGLWALEPSEAASLGLALGRVSRALLEITQAERIYTAALGEAVPHLHLHLVPRMAEASARGFGLFNAQAEARAGLRSVDPARAQACLSALCTALADLTDS